MHYIQPGKPDQNAYIERFNRSYRTEVLNAHLFESIAELRALTDAWLRIYNSERPHDSLGRVPPLTFLPRPSSTGAVYLSNCLLDGEAYAAIAREIRQLEETIDALHARVASIDRQVADWAKKNLTRITLDGEDLDPQDAARQVIDETVRLDWIPDPLGVGPEFAPQFGDPDVGTTP